MRAFDALIDLFEALESVGVPPTALDGRTPLSDLSLSAEARRAVRAPLEDRVCHRLPEDLFERGTERRHRRDRGVQSGPDVVDSMTGLARHLEASMPTSTSCPSSFSPDPVPL
jgi:hypothetical protein